MKRLTIKNMNKTYIDFIVKSNVISNLFDFFICNVQRIFTNTSKIKKLFNILKTSFALNKSKI